MSDGNSGNYTLVFYYIPEDYDELVMPNAYAIPKPLNDITLQDVENLFPLWQAQKKTSGPSSECPFHFRFKYKYNLQSVWLDINNKKVKVPKCDDKIIMKVTRKNAKYTIGDPNVNAVGAGSVQPAP